MINRYIITWFTSFLIASISTLYIKSVNVGNIQNTMIVEFICPIIAVFYYHYLFEEKSLMGKIKFASIQGTAYAIGSGVTIYFS